MTERKKRILIFAHYYAPDTASTGQILRDLAEGLREEFEVTVICAVPSYDGKVSPEYRTKRYYLEELNGSLPALNKIINGLFELLQTPEFGLEISTDFILQVLNDILYGIENEDAVFLLDVLRYGLLSVFYYIISELQSGGIHEQTSL